MSSRGSGPPLAAADGADRPHDRSAGRAQHDRHGGDQGHPDGRSLVRLCRTRSEKDKALGAEPEFEHIIDQVAGVCPKIMPDGTLDAGAWSCGGAA
jgi:hypothetical protein